MKDQDYVGCHPFLSNDDFLTAIDDKVAPLVELALLSVLDFLHGLHVVEVAKVGTNHDGNLADEHSSWVELLNYALHFLSLLVSLEAGLGGLFHLFFDNADVHVELCRICHVSNAGFVRENGCIHVVTLLNAGIIIDMNLFKYDIVLNIFLVLPARYVLVDDIDGVDPVFFDYLLHIEGEEPVERGDLLGHEAMLLEVSIDH
jgi:hypothetical protein